MGFRAWGVGSKDSSDGGCGPKYYSLNGIWDLSPNILVLGPLGKGSLGFRFSGSGLWALDLGSGV